VKAEHVHHPHARQCGREEIRALVGDRADKEGSAVHPNFAAKLLEEQTTAPPSLRRQAAFLYPTSPAATHQTPHKKSRTAEAPPASLGVALEEAV
jgi:hypothetical protein